MKTTFTLILSLNLLFLKSQVNSVLLDNNNVSAHISNIGTYFYDYENDQFGYEVPKGSQRNAIYTTQFLFAGKNTSGEIKLVQGGSPTQGTDIFHGPISGPGTYNTQQYQDRWENSIWKICQSDIDNYINWWKCNNGLLSLQDCNNVTPPSASFLYELYSWPAHGDVTQGQSYYLAPFYDNPLGPSGQDNLYRPEDGDYPLIKGCCAVYMIQNDVAQSHSYTNTDSIGIELHLMFYQYQTSDYLNDATFIDIKAINKSSIDYPEFVHSILVDADIGNYIDDNFGCDSINNNMFFYNGDNNDQDGSFYLGYGVDPPAIGIVSLENNISSCTPFTASTVSAKWNAMNGLKDNGTPWLDENMNATKFVFSGNPNTPSEWSAISSGTPPGDVRSISSYNHGSFNSGDTLKQTYAILYARDGNNLENVQNIIDLSEDVKTFYNSQSNISCNGGTLSLKENEFDNFKVYPNTTTGIIFIENKIKQDFVITVFDNVGNEVMKLPSSSNQINIIDIKDKSDGMYFLHFKSQDNTQVFKIIKH